MNRFFACFFVFFVFFVAGSHGETVKYTMCPGYENKCTINEIRVNPCKEAAKNKPCVLVKGEKANIAFDYSLDFNTSKLYVIPYWASITDLPFVGMDKNACKFTTCPVVIGNQQTYAYNLELSLTFPKGTYPLKWKISNEEGEVKCCFKFTIKMIEPTTNKVKLVTLKPDGTEENNATSIP